MKILIATATAGGGHLAAAAALEEAWKKRRPRDVLKRVDILDYTPRLYRKAYAEGYVKLAEKAPELYAHAFRKTDTLAFIKKAQTVRRFSARLMAGRFLKLVRRFRPDILLAPHFMPFEAMGSFKGPGRPLVAAIVTDFEAHALWIEPCVDFYCVATEETKARLLSRGIKSSRVAVTGIPVSLRFAQPYSQSVLRKRYGLASSSPVLLVLGGGLGMGPLVETMKTIDQLKEPFQVMVVAGRNETLLQKLRARRYRHPVRVFGFVSNMEELMGACDLIITKPGGLTSSEALAIGKPLLIVNPLPGQEAANSDFLLERGAAAKANRLDDLPFRLKTLLSPGRRRRMAQAAKKSGRPRAGEAVCRAVLAFMRSARAFLPILFLISAAQAGDMLQKDEEAIFYPVAAAARDDGQWEAPLRGWIFERKRDSTVERAMLRALRKSLPLPETALENPLFRERGGFFVVDNERGRRLNIRLGTQTFALAPSNAAGRIADRIVFSNKEGAETSSVSFQVEASSFSGIVLKVPAAGLSVISDIDDTIKISDVLDQPKLLARTFLEPYSAVPGMAEVYQTWQKEGAVFHYVSGSPSPLYPALAEFLRQAGMPLGTVTLRPFRPKSRELLSLSKPAGAFKIRAIEDLLRRFPQRQFILVGDSGEEDPETYGELARRHLPQIRFIAIRDVRNDVSSERFSKAFHSLPADRWTVFRHPNEMLERMTQSPVLWAKEADACLRVREGFVAALSFARSRPDLFPEKPSTTVHVLSRQAKEEVWNAWKRVLDSVVRLDVIAQDRLLMPLPGQKANTGNFTVGYAAFLARYRLALDWIMITDREPQFRALLNEPVPELGLAGGTYDQLRFRFLNAAQAAQFAAWSVVYQSLGEDKAGSEKLRQAIRDDTAALWAAGAGRGEALTVKNAWQVIQNAGFKAWFPIQTGVATWMGDTKAHRMEQSLISQEQIAAAHHKLQPGDIFFERREWYLSNLGLPGFWSHAALYLGTPEERRAYFKDEPGFEEDLRKRFPEAYRKSLEAFEGHTPAVLEAMSEGVVFTSLEHSAGADSWAVLRPRLSRQEKAEALRKAFMYAGRPYDFNFDFVTDSSLVCSEVVYKAYEPGAGNRGQTWEMSKVLGRPLVSPNDMIRQFDQSVGTAAQQSDFVLFLDGREWQKKAVERTEKDLRESWKRPKWDIWQQEK